MSSSESSQIQSLSEYNEHIPVLLNEVLSFIDKDKKGQVVVDMTLGRAGHSINIMNMLDKSSILYGCDRDESALTYSKIRLSSIKQKHYFIHNVFSKDIESLKELGVKGADFILMDIGVSSPQFDDPNRGFSYRYDAPLDMRMDTTQTLTAKEVVNTYSQEELKRILFEYGGEKFAGPISKRIVIERQVKPIETTFELVDVIKKALPERMLHKKGHPAKQTFMALRYEVNDERNELEKGLNDAIQFLNVGGKLLVISFNSDEDEMVRNTFLSYAPKVTFNRNLPLPDINAPYSILTKKGLTPSSKELEENPRSASAKLRVIERKN